MAIRTNYTSDEIFTLMKNKVNEAVSNKPTYWGQGSVAGGFLRAISFFVELLQLQINLAYLAFSIKTASIGHLIRRIADFGMTPYTAIYAVSKQTFVGDAGRVTDIIIPSGTEVKTTTEQGDTKFYVLSNSIILPLTEASVTGYCICTVSGSYGNVASNKINILSTPITGILSTTNLEDVGNGADSETLQQIRDRVPHYLLGLKKGNDDAIYDAVYGVEGITLVKIRENHPTAGNFAIYVSTETGVVDSITLDRIRTAVDAVKATTITYSIIAPIVSNITVSFDLSIDTQNYNQEDLIFSVKNTLKTYINSTSKSQINVADIIAKVLSIIGVLNIKTVKINTIADDLILNELYIAKINSDNDIIINII
jgi:uncharacterized phage protein gp47/JayE